MDKTRLRIRFSKKGNLRWIGHRDLARLWERLLRRAKLQLAFSEGFHPKPRISFPSALALGVEALDEVVELEIVGDVKLEEIEQLIRDEMPSGLDLLSLESPGYALGKAKIAGTSYRISTLGCADVGLNNRIERVLARETIEVQREKKVISCNISDPHFDLRLDGDVLIFSIPTVASGSIRPSELLEYVGLAGLLQDGATLQRTDVHLKEPEAKPQNAAV